MRQFKTQAWRVRAFWARPAWCAAGALGVALVTGLAFRLHLSFGAASFGYLCWLVVQSFAGEMAASVLVSFLSVACLDYFFVPPLFSLRVHRPLDLLALVSFLATSLVITKLVSKVRAGTELSRLHEEKLRRLYELAQQLLALEPDPAGGGRFLEPFCGVFGIRAACLFDATNAEVYIAGNAGDDLEKRTGDAFIRGADSDFREHGIAVRCIRVSGRTTGAIGFEGLEDPRSTAGPLAALAAAQWERTHSFLHASRAASAAQTEAYRTVILDALAHEFKTSFPPFSPRPARCAKPANWGRTSARWPKPWKRKRRGWAG